MHDDDFPVHFDPDPHGHDHVSIELHGGPLGGRVWTGPAVPTIDNYPTSFEIRDDLTVLAGGIGVIPVVMAIPLGFYSPTGEICVFGHRVYVWEMQEARWN